MGEEVQVVLFFCIFILSVIFLAFPLGFKLVDSCGIGRLPFYPDFLGLVLESEENIKTHMKTAITR